MPEKCEALEELRWSPGVPDCDLMMYLRAARSMAAFAGMCDGGSAEDGCIAASRDDTTINAMDLLHDSSYDTGKALQALVKNPIPPGIEKKWIEDETKRFVKGLRQYGKNFFKIRKELLPHKETSDLVEFYYLWKKSPAAVTSRTHRRHRRQNTLRRIRPNPRPSRPTSNDYMDASSGSDDAEDSEDSDSRDISGYTCQNCFTTSSKDWLPVGKDLAVMCTECRLYYKKHGELRPVDSKENLPFLFQPVKEEEFNGKHIMRTRRSKERQSPKTVVSDTVSLKGGRKSPGAASNCSTSSNDREKKKKLPQDNSLKGKKRIKEEKISLEDEVDDDKLMHLKKSNSRPDSPLEAMSTESSASNEYNVPDGEAPSSPSPALTPAHSPNISIPHLPEREIEPERSEDASQSKSEESLKVGGGLIPPLALEAVMCPVQVKQEIETTDVPEPSEAFHESISQINVPSPLNNIKEEVETTHLESSPVPSPLNFDQIHEATLPVAEDTASCAIEQSSFKISPDTINHEDNLVSLQYPGPSPQNIKVEPMDVPSPPPTNLPIHDPEHHSLTYPPSSSVHFSSSMSISMSSTNSVPSSISASASISMSYNKLPFPNHSSLMTSSQSSLSSFNYRSFSPQYPYPPGLPFSHLPSQQGKQKYSPSPSPNTPQNPPSISSPCSVPTLTPYRESSTPGHTFSPENNSVLPHSTQSNTGLVASSPQPSHPILPQAITTSCSLKTSPVSHSQQTSVLSQVPVNNKNIPQPAHQSSVYSHVMPGLPTSTKGSGNNHVQRLQSVSHLHNQPSSLIPTPSQHLPSTSYVSSAPSQIPSQGNLHFVSERVSEVEKCSIIQESLSLEEEDESEPHFLARGPSPEPRVEDIECHRSQSAIFLRHWNRGEFNSCARTDLTFKPVPDSKLARKREERARKLAEKEREENKARLGSTPENKPGSSSQNDNHHLSPFDRHVSRGGPDTPALRQLSEYARPHATTFSPGYSRPPATSSAGSVPLSVLPHGIDPILHYQLTSGMYGAAARESYRLEIEMEREKRERDLHDKLKAEFEMKSRLPPGSYDPHWIELQRRYSGLQGVPSVHPTGINHGPFGLYTPAERERLGIGTSVPVTEAAMDRMNAERVHSERLMLSTDPLLRLQMAGLAPELHTHAHTHAHAHTHLHLHPHDAVSAAAAAAAAMVVPSHPSMEPSVHASSSSHPLLPPTGYASSGPRPGIVSRTELLHPASGMMRPPYEDPLAHQLSAQLVHHEQLQRQLLIERERFAHMGAAMPHPSQLISQHEEFLRQQQQRERELKLRTLEEAARGGRPPLN